MSDWSISQGLINRQGAVAAHANGKQTLDSAIILVTGSTAFALTPSAIEPAAFAWLPTGDALLVSEMADAAGPTQLAVYGTDGARQRSVPLQRPLFVGAGIAVLADGSHAIVGAAPPGLGTSAGDLYEIDLASGAVRQLTNTPDVGEHGPQLINDVTVAYSARAVPDRTAPAGYRGWIGVLDRNSLSTRELTSIDDAANQATVTPDGRDLVYVGVPTREKPGNDGLWAVPVAGGIPVRLAAEAGRLPVVTPSGDGVWTTVTDGKGYGSLRFIRFTTRP